jgi:hypothetical protein
VNGVDPAANPILSLNTASADAGAIQFAKRRKTGRPGAHDNNVHVGQASWPVFFVLSGYPGESGTIQGLAPPDDRNQNLTQPKAG